MPPPPRKLVLPLPVGSQANPKRGAKFFLVGEIGSCGSALIAGNTNPGARREIVSTVVRESLRRFAPGCRPGCVVFVAQSESQDQVRCSSATRPGQIHKCFCCEWWKAHSRLENMRRWRRVESPHNRCPSHCHRPLRSNNPTPRLGSSHRTDSVGKARIQHQTPVVLPLRPRQSFGPGEGVFEVARRAVFTGPM